MKFKSTYPQELVYLSDRAVQFHNYEYETADKKEIAELSKVVGITKVEEPKRVTHKAKENTPA